MAAVICMYADRDLPSSPARFTRRGSYDKHSNNNNTNAMSLIPFPKNTTPESFVGKPEALQKDFFQTWAAQLGPPMDARVEAISMKLLTAFARATLGQMFQLTTLQFDNEVAIASGIDKDAAAGVRMTIESILDRKFLPAIARVQVNGTALGMGKGQTISAMLSEKDMDAIVVPMPPRTMLQTKNPAHTTLKENDVKIYVQWRNTRRAVII